MADIVQLKENGVFKYLKTHAAAVEGLPELLAKKQDVPFDSGWITAVTSGVTPDGDKPLCYRRVGNKMYFRGGGTFPTAAGTVFLVIPVAYAPKGQPAFFDSLVRDSDSTRKCIIQVQLDGSCRIISNSFSGNPVFLDGFDYLTD